jgi:hypothetical protein
MQKFKTLTLFTCLLFSISYEIIAQGSISQSDSIEMSNMNKWVRVAKKEYPSDVLRQNVSIFANSFWGNKENATIIKNGMNSFWENNLHKNVKSFQGSFSFLVSFDDKGNVQKLSFSKNVSTEFISVVQNNFKSLLANISHRDKLKGAFKNKKILLRLNLIWSFTNLQGLKDYIDDGLNNLEFSDEGSTLGEVLISPSNLMSREI